MKRVTAEQVVKAYEQTGVTPISHSWYKTNQEGLCTCGLTAMYLHEEKDRIGTQEQVMLNALKEESAGKWFSWIIEEKLGLHKSYVNGFVEGFDNGTIHDDGNQDPEVFAAGFHDGYAARELLLANGAELV